MGQLQEQFLKHVEQSQGIIRKVCAAYCFTPSDREDMFQNILVQAWKAFPQFREEAAFSTWLYKIAICTAITANRKANPASTMESKYIDFSEMIDSDQEPKIESRDILRKSFQ
jgi:RNA polymerase sigma-70 factor (ECF subfamily)